MQSPMTGAEAQRRPAGWAAPPDDNRPQRQPAVTTRKRRPLPALYPPRPPTTTPHATRAGSPSQVTAATYQIVGWAGWTAPHPPHPPRDGRCRHRHARASVAPSPSPATRRSDGQGRARRTRGGAAPAPDGGDLPGVGGVSMSGSGDSRRKRVLPPGGCRALRLGRGRGMLPSRQR